MRAGIVVTSLDPRDNGATFVIIETGIDHVSGATSRVAPVSGAGSPRYRLDRNLRPFIHAPDCDMDEDCTCTTAARP